MIGVIPKADQIAVAEEFFQLFKTPWEIYEPGRTYDVVVATTDEIPEVDTRLLLIYGSAAKSSDARSGIAVGSRHQGASLNYQGILLPIYGEVRTFEERSAGIPCVTAESGMAGLRVRSADSTVMRLGYDLFHEVQLLLSAGQPVEKAHIPTLDIHIMMLRNWILDAGISLLEVPPSPAGHSFVVCLTHDIDFVGSASFPDLARGSVSSVRVSRLGERFLGSFRLVFTSRKGSARHLLLDSFQEAHWRKRGRATWVAARRRLRYHRPSTVDGDSDAGRV